MNGGREDYSVVVSAYRGRAALAAASVMSVSLLLAGCVQVEPGSSSPSTSSSPSPSASETSTPLPTPDPLIIPGCETLLPLTTAKALFSRDTEAFGEDDTIVLRGDELPEIASAVSDATIAKNCIWAVPRSDGSFALSIADISEADRVSVSDALIAAGYTGSADGEVTTFEREFEGGVSLIGEMHLFTSDLWIYVQGTSLSLTNAVANSALDELRLANPTRTY